MSYGNYPDLTGVKRVLVVKLRHHGDVLLTSPVFSHLKKVLPDAEIDAFVYAETLPMLEGHPAISNFLLYDRRLKKRSFLKRFAGEAKLLNRVRKGNYDLVINLTEGDRGAIIALVSGAKVRVGFDPHGAGFAGKRKIFTHLVKTPNGPRHTTERQLDSLRRIGIFPGEEDKPLTFNLPEVALEKMRSILREKGINEGEFF
ncbi:MAG: glycosyltransferase family 9 protein, partial [Chlamydiales bacterium]